MTVIDFNTAEFHKTVSAWFYKYHGQPLSERLLSRFGAAVLDEKQLPLAVTYIYPVVACDIAWIGFTARDPFISSYQAGKALKLLIPAAEDYIRRMGYPIAYVAFDSLALQKLVAKRGYVKGSMVQEYFKELT